jgi:heme oxygenase
MTPGLEAVLDLRGRTGPRLLRSDLVALGVPDPGALERCTNVLPFRSPAEALGWLYVVERDAMLHGILLRHLEQRLGDPFARACAYLAGNERAAGVRMRELGRALDVVARAPKVAERVVDAACAAFRCQRAWFARGFVPRVRVA